MEFDEPVHGFGAAVGRAAGVEVGQELSAPFPEGSSEAGDLGDRGAWEAVDDLLGESPADGRVWLVVDPAKLLGALPGHEHLEVCLVGVDRFSEASLLAFGEPFLGAAQHVADLVERVVAAAPVTGEGLLDARRTSSTSWLPSLKTWNASRTDVASSSWSSIAFL